ncbi:transcription repressor NadR [Enterococcus timonensis]|uniref:transcription repressor NadR n=1 Tax=Enterococcus timonensis TaxID=1852364 RepID=UPI0008DA0BF9|nr:transcription repressor NadR [Enterococcus timonensis]
MKNKLTGDTRREKILTALRENETATSATALAKKLEVSRQIIVGDVALLRASGEKIIATGRGYLLETNSDGLVSQIACRHTFDQTALELQVIIQHGGTVQDVLVEHPLYGELKGGLYLSTLEDVDHFISEIKKKPQLLLSTLTGGVHLHTIVTPSVKELNEIKKALDQVGILYKD